MRIPLFDKACLSGNAWRGDRPAFHGWAEAVSPGDQGWSKALTRSRFNAIKPRLLRARNGGASGIEADGIGAAPAPVE
jgi:hypothetical protein